MKKNRKLKNLSLILVLILTISILYGCKHNDNESIENNKTSLGNKEEEKIIKVEDDEGNILSLKKPATKIISLAPSHTEILFSLGLDEEIKGVTTYCDYPKQAQSKDKIGTFMDLNLEKIISLDPELVIGVDNLDDEVKDLLEDSDIQVLTLSPNNIEETYEAIKKISMATGREDEAEKLINDLELNKDEILRKVKNTEKKDVFFEIADNPLIAAGAGSFINELISLSNANNIAEKAEGQYPEYSVEMLIEENPEVYLVSEGDPEKTEDSIKNRPGYESIKAIRQNNIYFLDANITSRPGPRIIEALELVAKSIHPDMFN